MSPFYAEFIGQMEQYKILAYNNPNVWNVRKVEDYCPDVGKLEFDLIIKFEDDTVISMSTDGMHTCIYKETDVITDEEWNPSHERILSLLLPQEESNGINNSSSESQQ